MQEKIDLLIGEEELQNLEKAKGSINVRSVLPGQINPEDVAPTLPAPIIHPEKEINKIQAPRMNKGSNHTEGRPKDFLKKRKKKHRMRNKTKNSNRRKK